jgi:hypothetical protein
MKEAKEEEDGVKRPGTLRLTRAPTQSSEPVSPGTSSTGEPNAGNPSVRFGYSDFAITESHTHTFSPSAAIRGRAKNVSEVSAVPVAEASGGGDGHSACLPAAPTRRILRGFPASPEGGVTFPLFERIRVFW